MKNRGCYYLDCSEVYPDALTIDLVLEKGVIEQEIESSR